MATRALDSQDCETHAKVAFRSDGNYSEHEKYLMTLEGLADARAGRTVSNERVMAWLESLDTDSPLPMPEP